MSIETSLLDKYRNARRRLFIYSLLKKTQILAKIICSHASSSERSQDVWRQINKLRKDRKESTVEEETLISPEAWIQHFDNHFMITMKQMKIRILQMTRNKRKICQMMKS